MQFDGSKTFNKEGIPSVGMAPKNAKGADLGKRSNSRSMKERG